jgi:ectoine hydroxylase-related dioxygenase (phytanoyl-CoA dioxygenase family)
MTALINILKYPVWFIAVFSTAKSFSANKVLGNRMLNRIGLHAVRYCLAHLFGWLRILQMRRFVSSEHAREYQENGVVVIENFLPEKCFLRLQKEVLTTKVKARQCIQGETCTQRIFLDYNNKNTLPVCHQVTNEKEFKQLQKYVSSHNTTPVFYIQRIKNGFNKGKADPQKKLHSDTFHATMKSWLFLEDVGKEKGPLNYIPGSHRFSLKRLAWEYHKSIQILDNPDGYSEKGSLRLDEMGRSTLELKPVREFTVKANTLIIANTHGFHGRGEAESGQSRLELWGYSRSNPFLPLAGFDLPGVPLAKQFAINYFLKFKDWQAVRNKSRASWHVIDNDTFHRTLE